MAQRPSIILSKEAAEAIKKRYTARGETATADAIAKGSGVYVTKTKEASALIGASMDSRANAWNQLTVKAALSQGEEDVKISLGMLGSPAQYKAANTRMADLAAIRAARSDAGTARWEAKKARLESEGFDATSRAETQQFQKVTDLRAQLARDLLTPTRGSETVEPFNDSERRGRAYAIDQDVIESAKRNREFVDQPLEAPSAWDSFVSDVTQSWRMGKAVGAPLNAPILSSKLWKTPRTTSVLDRYLSAQKGL